MLLCVLERKFKGLLKWEKAGFTGIFCVSRYREAFTRYCCLNTDRKITCVLHIPPNSSHILDSRENKKIQLHWSFLPVQQLTFSLMETAQLPAGRSESLQSHRLLKVYKWSASDLAESQFVNELQSVWVQLTSLYNWGLQWWLTGCVPIWKQGWRGSVFVICGRICFRSLNVWS